MQTSIMEGGANAISEALAARLPVPTSYIRGNVGIVGEDYPGYYLVGDEKALARVRSIAGRPTVRSTRPSKPSVTNIGIWCYPSAKRRLQGVWWRRSGPEQWARIQSACGREDAHKADEVLAEGRLSF